MQRGVTFLQGYGLSEAGPLALLLDAASGLEKIGSAGRPPAFVRISVQSERDGERARCCSTADGCGRATPRGWTRTGYIWIVEDTISDRFETAGGVVFPGDVERVLLANPAVVDAGVVGVPSADGGEVGAGFVVSRARRVDDDRRPPRWRPTRACPGPCRSRDDPAGRRAPTEQRRKARAPAAPRNVIRVRPTSRDLGSLRRWYRPTMARDAGRGWIAPDRRHLGGGVSAPRRLRRPYRDPGGVGCGALPRPHSRARGLALGRAPGLLRVRGAAMVLRARATRAGSPARRPRTLVPAR